jgi:glycogen debranching enzyme
MHCVPFALADEQKNCANEVQGYVFARILGPALPGYVIGLEQDKKQCRVRASNKGHCLMTGIAAPRHARLMANI